MPMSAPLFHSQAAVVSRGVSKCQSAEDNTHTCLLIINVLQVLLNGNCNCGTAPFWNTLPAACSLQEHSVHGQLHAHGGAPEQVSL